MPISTDDVRITNIRPLIPPAILMEDIPPTPAMVELVANARATVGNILHGRDDRLVVVTGPCSIHDPHAGHEYAERLRAVAQKYENDLFLVMRTYFEKPRTTIGWKGLINDPRLDGSFDINTGLRTARNFLRGVLERGVPTGTEFLDPISPQFVADLVAWGAIGARTTESQVHRELASGLSMPVGFKNGTKGTIQIAVDAVGAAVHPHHFLSVTKQGLAAIVATQGNPDCHIILRGGANQPNYSAEHVDQSVSLLVKAGLAPRVMIDCSHANSHKDHERQPQVAEDVAGQIADGSHHVFGLMLESFLLGGRQNQEPGRPLVYGQSITDACMSWEATVPVLDTLAKAVAARRKKTKAA